MPDSINNTFTEYLGSEFQLKLLWQFLVEPDFAIKIYPDLHVDYFDEMIVKRLFVVISEYIKNFEKAPNIQNKSIHQAITLYKTQNNKIEEDALFMYVKRIEMYNEMVINKPELYDGDVIQRMAYAFIKQQEYRKLGEHILNIVKKGDMKNISNIKNIEEKFQKVSCIGEANDDSEDVFDNIDNALRIDFRETIPTGIEVIDALTGGGLGKGEIGLILSPSGVGKSQGISAKISTPYGWKRMGDIKVGDIVTGSDGGSQTVLGVYPQGKRRIYKIEFNDGTSTHCDGEHLWAVNDIKLRDKRIAINGKRIKYPDLLYSTIKTTKELMKDYKVYAKKNVLNYRIPIVKPVEYNNDYVLPLNPYLLGALIGDGTLKGKCVQFTNIDEEILNEVRNVISCDFPELSLKQKPSETKTYTISNKKYSPYNRLNNALKELRLKTNAEFKHIPDIYKYASIQDRISMLQGLLDTDGYASKNGRVQFYTVSDKLADDVRELVLSLGGFCKIKTKVGKYKKDGVVVECKKLNILTLSFSDSNIKLFKLKRKQDRVVYREKYKYNKYISSIKFSHYEEAQCIYVSNDDHLYVTDDFIVTHNTTSLTKIANTAYDAGKNVLQIVFEDTKDQVKRKHYAIFTKTPLSELDNNIDYLRTEVRRIREENRRQGGRLIIKPFSQDGTTMVDIKNWIIRYQKKYGIIFDLIVLDYLDCVESHKKVSDRNENELVVIKAFEALASELNIPAWSAIQTNRSGFNAEMIEASQSGGSIKRIQKSHFFMSIGKSQDQKDANLATISILKARFAKDGQVFKDCIFNNDTLEIRIIDSIQKTKAFAKNLKSVERSDVERVEHRIDELETNKIKSALDDMRDKFINKQNEIPAQTVEIPESVITKLEDDNQLQTNIVAKPIVNYLDIESQFLSEEDLKNDDDIERYLRENRNNEEN